MKYKALAIASVIILLTSVVLAVQDISFPIDNWLGRVFSAFKEIADKSVFTVYGDELGCDKTPTKILRSRNDGTRNYDEAAISGFPIAISPSLVNAETVAINLFRGSPTGEHQYLGELFLKKNEEWYFYCDAGAYWNKFCYVDLYACPNPCYANSDCKSGEYCDKSVLSQVIPDAGVCRITSPTHQTQVYRCENGVKTDLGKVGYGNPNFCIDPKDIKYLIGTTDKCLNYEPDECKKKIKDTCAKNYGKCQLNVLSCPKGYVDIGQLDCIGGHCCVKSEDVDLASCQGTCRMSQCMDEEISVGKLDCSHGTCCVKNEEVTVNETKVRVAKQPSLTWRDWKEASPAMRIKTVCSTDENCQPYEDLTGGNKNYTVKCKQTNEIIEQLNQDYKEVCKTALWRKITTSTALLTGIGCGATVALSVICGPPSGGLCSAALVPLTVYICATSATTATASLAGCAIWAQADLSKGACIAIPSGGEKSWCSIVSSLAFLKITGDECTDGSIILGIIIFFGIIIFTRI